MVESPGGPSLLLEARQSLGIRGDSRRQDLDRHVTFDARIPRAIDLAHTARAKETDDLIRPENSADHRSRSSFRQGFGSYVEGGRFQEVLGLRITSEERFDFVAKLFVGTGL